MESEGLKDDAILVAGAFNAQLHETQMLTVDQGLHLVGYCRMV